MKPNVDRHCFNRVTLDEIAHNVRTTTSASHFTEIFLGDSVGTQALDHVPQ